MVRWWWAIAWGAMACGSDDGAASEDADTNGEAASGETTIGDATSGEPTNGEEGSSGPLPEPEPGPGACGWSGDGFACGWAPSAHACPPGTEVFGACEDEPPCCVDEHTLLSCQCLDNACTPQWRPSDCIHGGGAGMCGWAADAAAYVCGGAGEDPGGSAIACPPADPTQPCDGVPLGTSCCDADGNARLCTDLGSNGNPYWSTIDCVLGD